MQPVSRRHYVQSISECTMEKREKGRTGAHLESHL